MIVTAALTREASGGRPNQDNAEATVSLRERASMEKAGMNAQVRGQLTPPPPHGTVYLGSLASVVRTKNCGPFELTMDVMFSDRATYDRVRSAEILSRDTISQLYHIDKPEDI